MYLLYNMWYMLIMWCLNRIFYPIMHIVFPCVHWYSISNTSETWRWIVSKKNYAACCSDITRNIKMQKQIYKEQLFMGTISWKNNCFFENEHGWGTENEWGEDWTENTWFPPTFLYNQCLDWFRYCKHPATIILHAKNALNLWLFFSLTSSKHWIINWTGRSRSHLSHVQFPSVS